MHCISLVYKATVCILWGEGYEIRVQAKIREINYSLSLFFSLFKVSPQIFVVAEYSFSELKNETKM